MAGTLYLDGIIIAEVPALMEALCDRVASAGAPRPNAITMNEYQRGQGLGWHADTVQSGELISILGLSAAAELVFRRDRKPPEITVVIPPRTLVQLSGPCRYLPWEHRVRPVAQLRYSLVFRHGAA